MTDYGEMLHVVVFVLLQHQIFFVFPMMTECCCFFGFVLFFCCVAQHQAIKTLIRSK